MSCSKLAFFTIRKSIRGSFSQELTKNQTNHSLLLRPSLIWIWDLDNFNKFQQGVSRGPCTPNHKRRNFHFFCMTPNKSCRLCTVESLCGEKKWVGLVRPHRKPEETLRPRHPTNSVVARCFYRAKFLFRSSKGSNSQLFDRSTVRFSPQIYHLRVTPMYSLRLRKIHIQPSK